MLGWAHKYAELAKDFGMEQFLLNPTDAGAKLEGLIERLLDSREQEALRKILSEKKASMIQPNRTMWQETVACLQSTPGS
jgi:hypothetical protein